MLHFSPSLSLYLTGVGRGWCSCSLSRLKAWGNHPCSFSMLSSCRCCSWVCLCTWETCGCCSRAHRVIQTEFVRLALEWRRCGAVQVILPRRPQSGFSLEWFRKRDFSRRAKQFWLSRDVKKKIQYSLGSLPQVWMCFTEPHLQFKADVVCYYNP